MTSKEKEHDSGNGRNKPAELRFHLAGEEARRTIAEDVLLQGTRRGKRS